MYQLVLVLHSWVRWALLVALLWLLARAVRGWRLGLSWQRLDQRLVSWTLALADVQLLLGLALFVGLSPATRPFFQQGPAAMANPQTAYWVMEHALPMIAAVFLAHVAHVFVRRGDDDRRRYRRAALLFGAVAVIVLFSTPWPFMPQGRPLFRFG